MVDSSTPANCTSCDGTADISVSGGTAPYTYQWTNGNSDEDPMDLCSGVNEVTVTDANGCELILNTSIGNTSSLTIDGITVDGDVTCAGFSDGQATATASAGQPPYTYTWDDPANQTTATITGLSGGTYNLTVQDSDGCIAVDNVMIDEPGVLSVNVVLDADASCNGFLDGQATATPSGGTTPYTYLWSSGETDATASALGAGTASVTITDANACTTDGSTPVNEPGANA